MYKINCHRIDNPNNSVIGLASLVVDDKFKLDSIRLIKTDKNERGFFLAMPSYETSRRDENNKPIYKELFHPTSKKFMEDLNKAAEQSFRLGVEVEFRRDVTEQIGSKVTISESENSSIKGDVVLFFSADNEVNMVCDSFKIRETSKGDMISAPSRKTVNGEYKNVCYPITKDFRSELYGEIFTKYNQAKNIDQAASKDTAMAISDATEEDLMMR